MHLHLGTSTAAESRHTACALLKGTAKVGVERVQSVTHPLHILTLLWEAGGRGFKGEKRKLWPQRDVIHEIQTLIPLDLLDPLTSLATHSESLLRPRKGRRGWRLYRKLTLQTSQ